LACTTWEGCHAGKAMHPLVSEAGALLSIEP